MMTLFEVSLIIMNAIIEKAMRLAQWNLSRGCDWGRCAVGKRARMQLTGSRTDPLQVTRFAGPLAVHHPCTDKLAGRQVASWPNP